MPEKCDICFRTYANVDAYNAHLNRPSHYRKCVQFEMLYSQYPDSIKYHEWRETLAKCDRPRTNNK